MKRVVFNLAAGISLVLCIGSAAMWIRSDQSGAPDMITAQYSRWSPTDQVDSYFFEAASYGGTFALQFDHTRIAPSYFDSPQRRQELKTTNPPGFVGRFIPRRIPWFGCSQRSGFGFGHTIWTPTAHLRGNYNLLTFRPWPAVALFAMLPALRLNGWRKSRSLSRNGFCRKCGYDLRATPDRCPECGTIAHGAIAMCTAQPNPA